MQIKETYVARGVSPFIMKAGAFPILSSIMKAGTSPFITIAGVSPISYIETSVRMSCLYFISPL
jgi:hypothetical protein